MRRFGLILLVLAAAAGFARIGWAATTITADEGGPTDALGPGIWQLTIQGTDALVNNGGQFGVVNAVSFTPASADSSGGVCDPNAITASVICSTLPGGDIGAPANILYFIIAVVSADLQNLTTLGTVQGTGIGLTIEGTGILTGTGDDAGFSPVVSFNVIPIPIVPEPAAFAFLGLGLASLAFLRRQAA